MLSPVWKAGISEREQLAPYKTTLFVVGVFHTLLCAGTVYGWSSLEAILRAEGSFGESPDQLFAAIFTLGAVGSYISNLPFGVLLDTKGPKITGMVSSACYFVAFACAARGCTYASPTFLALGIFGIGFVGPALQLPTLGLGCLFSDGGTISMSVQAAAYDGGTFVFAAARELYFDYGVPSGTFLTYFMLVPVFTFVTGYLFWPLGSLEEANDKPTPAAALKALDAAIAKEEAATVVDEAEDFSGRLLAAFDLAHTDDVSQQGGPGAPFLAKTMSFQGEEYELPVQGQSYESLDSMLKSRPFLFLALFAATHILKLNFIITSINAQTLANFSPEDALQLTKWFGYMLPFGFVSAPVTVYLLATDPVKAFVIANWLSFVYGLIFCYGESGPLLVGLAFPIIALSKQLVYSSIFHCIGAEFGFGKYGTLLGIINVTVAAFGLVQYPLVSFSTNAESYAFANWFLLLLAVPFFGVRYYLPPGAFMRGVSSENAPLVA